MARYFYAPPGMSLSEQAHDERERRSIDDEEFDGGEDGSDLIDDEGDSDLDDSDVVEVDDDE